MRGAECLAFVNGTAWVNMPKENSATRYGPACGKKNLLLTHLILPNDTTESEIGNFIESLQRMYESYKFGSIKKDEYLKVLQYNVDAGVQEIENKIRTLDKVESGGKYWHCDNPG